MGSTILYFFLKKGEVLFQAEKLNLIMNECEKTFLNKKQNGIKTMITDYFMTSTLNNDLILFFNFVFGFKYFGTSV